MLTHRACGSGVSHRNNLVMTTALISFDVNRNRIAEPKTTTHQKREHGLEGLQGTAMTTDKNRKIGGGHIENELSFITLILIDRGIGSVKITKDRTKNRDSNISDGVELFIGELFACFICCGDFRIVT
ncbi:uncharacterized protein BN589_01072 [Collinsella sp. CAG:289]|nr:uncharacterized protein BN589_01072 [Collinsella sp. CAG:289]